MRARACVYSRSQWPRGLRRRFAAARLLRLWVRIPPGAWMFVCCECCVLSGRGLCDGLITRPEESYLLWCVVVCEEATARDWAASAERKKIYTYIYKVTGTRMLNCKACGCNFKNKQQERKEQRKSKLLPTCEASNTFWA